MIGHSQSCECKSCRDERHIEQLKRELSTLTAKLKASEESRAMIASEHGRLVIERNERDVVIATLRSAVTEAHAK